MYSSGVRQALAAIAISLLILPGTALATELTSAQWTQEDLMIRFSDSVFYEIDLAASDTSQLVIRFLDLSVADSSLLGSQLQGPIGRKAILTKGGPGEIRLTVVAPEHMGYATIWRPYSKGLLIHTFKWENLSYGQEQYYKALLGFEQSLPAQGIELLRMAHATGDRRAASVLGVYYARRGENALASQYLEKNPPLNEPIGIDTYAALAALQIARGDSATSLQSQQAFEQRNRVAKRPDWDAEQAPASSASDPGPKEPRKRETMEHWLNAENWPYLAGAGGLLLLLIFLIAWWVRRPATKSEATPGPIRPEPRVVARETTLATREEIPVHEVPAEAVPSPTPSPVVVPVTTQQKESLPASVEVPTPTIAYVQPIDVRQPQTIEPVTPTQAENVAEPEEVIEEPLEKPLPVVEEDEQEATIAAAEPVSRPRRTMPSQATELRQRIEAMRATTAPTSRPTSSTPAVADESTLSEARRLQLSRDSVDLRRRLEEAMAARR